MMATIEMVSKRKGWLETMKEEGLARKKAKQWTEINLKTFIFCASYTIIFVFPL